MSEAATPLPNEKLVRVFDTEQESEAMVVKGLLDSAGIDSHFGDNENSPDVLLVGGFLAWAVADRISLKKRPARPLPGAPAGPMNDAIAVVGGLALYALFVFKAHAWLFGVSPLG